MRKLRSLQLDTTIDLQGLLKSGLLALASGARRRICGSRAQEFSRYLGNFTVPQLPAEIRDAPPAQFARHYDTIAKAYVQSLDRVRRLLRTL